MIAKINWNNSLPKPDESYKVVIDFKERDEKITDAVVVFLEFVAQYESHQVFLL